MLPIHQIFLCRTPAHLQDIVLDLKQLIEQASQFDPRALQT